MIRNKYIISPFLFLAWAIIFVHSIIPHHHHEENFFAECIECHVHGHTLSDNSCIWNNDNDSKDHVCHFKVETFTQVSIDNIFIVNSDNSFLSSSISRDVHNIDYYVEFISEQIPKTNFLRGPPKILIS